MTFDKQLALWATGTPRPQGSIAFKGMRGKKPILTSDNVNLKAWREVVTRAAREMLPEGWQPLDEPVLVAADYWLAPPRRPRWIVPAVKPDLDKLTRATLDSLGDAGVYINDSRVVEFGRTRKLYADADHPPGAIIAIEWGNWG